MLYLSFGLVAAVGLVGAAAGLTPLGGKFVVGPTPAFVLLSVRETVRIDLTLEFGCAGPAITGPAIEAYTWVFRTCVPGPAE